MVSSPSPPVPLVAVKALVVLLLSLAVVETFNITILHTNDVHARFDQFNTYGSPCSEEEASEGECFGGYPRLVTTVRDLKKQYRNVLLLDGGDQYQGTLWFYKFGGNVTAHFMNWLGYDAMSLGNHEFDRGPEGLIPFLNDVNFSVVSANVNASLVPAIQNRVTKSVTRTIDGEKLGIVGYLTEETPDISSPGDVKVGSVIDAVQAEVKELEDSGINKIIALGHAGFTVDKEVAAIPGVDIVVGGHTNTFLYTGTPPSIEQPEGNYPFVVEKAGGKALVVQDYTFGKYLGVLHVTFDADGQVIDYGGNPMLLDDSVARDNATLEELKPWQAELAKEGDKVIGTTLVNLNGSRLICRKHECNMGNLIADAMVRQNLRHPDEKSWNDVSIAIMNSGGIRDSIVRGDIKIANVLNVLPFQNTVDAMELKGEHLKAALEHSVSRYDNCKQTDLFGGFLQVSGLRITYDLTKPVGQRVVKVLALCTECIVPQFFPLEDDKVYKILLPSFTANGGDGFTVLKENAISTDLLGDLDSDVLIEYIKSNSPIIHGVDGRIQYQNQGVCGPVTDSGQRLSATTLTTLVTVLCFLYVAGQ